MNGMANREIVKAEEVFYLILIRIVIVTVIVIVAVAGVAAVVCFDDERETCNIGKKSSISSQLCTRERERGKRPNNTMEGKKKGEEEEAKEKGKENKPSSKHCCWSRVCVVRFSPPYSTSNLLIKYTYYFIFLNISLIIMLSCY